MSSTHVPECWPGTHLHCSRNICSICYVSVAPIDENQFVLLRRITEGCQVVLERLDRHRVGDQWFELPVTGVFEVADGKIGYWREYFDFETIRQDLTRIFGASA